MRRASVRVRTSQAAELLAALQPEAVRPLPRTRVALTAEEEALHLEVAAEDTSALRAALNSYLRWTATAVAMMEETA